MYFSIENNTFRRLALAPQSFLEIGIVPTWAQRFNLAREPLNYFISIGLRLFPRTRAEHGRQCPATFLSGLAVLARQEPAPRRVWRGC